MITVHIDMIDLALDVDGHADAPREGEFDLVCCAASTIGQQMLYSMEAYQDGHDGFQRIETEMDKGHLHIRIRAKEWARIAAIKRLEYAREGFDMLAERYPEYIKIKED